MNSANSGNLVNQWGRFEQPFSQLCFVGNVVASSSQTHEVAGSKPFNNKYFGH